MKKINYLFALALCFSLSVGSPTVASAQSNNEAATTRNDADDHDDDNEANYGWIGLIGLAGLLGLRKKDKHDNEVRSTSTVR